MKGLLATIVLCLATVTALADCDTGSCSDVKLTQLYLDANDTAYITTTGNQSNLSCAQVGNLLVLPGTAVNFKALYATLLAAM